MSIVYPDNDKRQQRLIELGSDCQDFLFQATTDYNSLQTLLPQVNSDIAALYKSADLPPPNVSKLDVMQQAGLADDEVPTTILDISDLITGVAGAVGSVKYLAPAVTKALVSTGAMTEETAAKVLVDFTVPIVDKEVTITVGDLAGQIIGGVLSGVAVAGIDLGIEAIEGKVACDHLRDGINNVFPMRAAIKLSQDKSATLLSSLTAVKTSCDAITGAGIDLTDQIIKNLIAKDCQPSIDKANAITPTSTAALLASLDQSRGSWTNEDP